MNHVALAVGGRSVASKLPVRVRAAFPPSLMHRIALHATHVVRSTSRAYYEQDLIGDHSLDMISVKRLLICITPDFDTVGNLQLWDALKVI
jgi:hypothetical protein